MNALFGTAGTPDDFKTMGFKSSADVPEYITKMNLDTFEYQCGQGVRIGKELAVSLGEKAKSANISLSLHAPYYISLSSIEEEKRINSVNYILQSAKAADFMGADRIIVHSGSCGKISRSEALELAKATLKNAHDALVSENLSHVRICPETMGKGNQLGDLAEVMELCKVDESFIPCIDFGHLNARDCGGIPDKAAYEKILDTIENELGSAVLADFHSHFSKIEYTAKGGEVRHLTFADTIYGPEFEPLMELIAKKNLSPRFICESAGTQGIDALAMKKYYLSKK
ncbi:MAG: TIM barrel protein [Oscillospiraceae bacterium]